MKTLGAILFKTLLLLLLIVQLPTRIFAAAFIRGSAQREVEDRAREDRKPKQRELVESGQADWCPTCEGAGSVFKEIELSRGRFEMWCSECEGSGLVSKK